MSQSMRADGDRPTPQAGDLAPRAADYFPWADPQFRRDPYPFYARAIEEAPVTRDADGSFVVTRYDDVVRCLRAPSVVIAPEWEIAGAWDILGNMALGHDEPDHTRLRRITGKWLTPKRIPEWVAHTALIVDEVLDRVGPDGVIDGSDLAVEATHRTICRLLQVPEDDIANVRKYMREAMPVLSAVPDQADFDACAAAHIYLRQRVADLIAGKREAPGDGIIDDLIARQDAGEMTADEVHATTLFLYFVGHMDASYLISSGFDLFSSRPEIFSTFRDEPQLRAAAVVELGRFDAPEPVVTRSTTEDLVLGGYVVPAGSRLRLLLGAANRDSEVFTDPSVFDMRRPPEQSRNLTFSIGTHSCQGRLLAEAEIRTVWERVAARFASIERAGDPELMLTDASRHYLTQPLRFRR